jgi:DNA-binding NtrC family response regulator
MVNINDGQHRAISGSILIVDDDPDLREKLEVLLRRRGYRVASTASSHEALERITQESFDLILSTTSGPGPEGLQLLNDLKARGENTAFVVMSAYATIDQSVAAMRQGAADYLTKPFQLYEVANVIERAIMRSRDAGIQQNKLVKNNDGQNQKNSGSLLRNPGPGTKQPVLDWNGERRSALIGSSRSMKQLFTIIDRIAPMDSSVLITGETGTGKELVARAIHERSPRAKGPFVDINCSAIPDTLLEAELFGHQRGTFTGAHETRHGLFEEASGGTIFLDEIDALELSAQAKLLRVLQERKLRRVGGRENIKVDVRVISATNSDLMKATAELRFRSDLFFRLRVVPLYMPTLRERDNDVKLLIDHFLRRQTERWHLPPRRFSAEAMKALLEYRWPGNVRELENAIEYALAIGTGDVLGVDDLPPDITKEREQNNDGLKTRSTGDLPLVEVERRHIIATLERFGGHQIKAAASLGIDRRTLYRKLQQYNLN